MTIRKRAIAMVTFLLAIAIFGLNAMAQNDASQTATSTTAATTKKSKKAKSSEANGGVTSTAPATSSKSTAATSSPTASTTPATSKTAESKTSKKASTPVQAQTPPQPGMVWVNTASGTYHKSGRWYGKTKEGKFMVEADAVKAGYKPAKD
jgi:cytoskeletal protein RodZ